jgi:hypothetical protein
MGSISKVNFEEENVYFWVKTMMENAEFYIRTNSH